MKPKFWLVWNERGTNPTYKHPDEHSARVEAERLAKKYGGQFHVLEVVATCEKNDVAWQNYPVTGKSPAHAPNRAQTASRPPSRDSHFDFLPASDPSHPAYITPDDHYDTSDPFADE